MKLLVQQKKQQACERTYLYRPLLHFLTRTMCATTTSATPTPNFTATVTYVHTAFPDLQIIINKYQNRTNNRTENVSK